MRKLLPILSAALFTLSATAQAQEKDAFQVHLETGAAIPLGNPLTSVFSPGPTLEVKALWSVHPNISIGPAVNGLYLPKTIDDGHGGGILWELGPSVRFQSDRKSTDHVFSHFNPWVDVDAMFAATGNLVRPAFNIGLGAESPLDRYRVFWLGPFARYQHVFSAENQHHDANLLQLGISLSFDSPIKLPTRTVKVETPVLQEKIIHEVEYKEIPVVVEKLDFSEVVYFDLDKSILRWESKDKLDKIVAKLNAHPQLHIEVQGNASSDGLLQHNNKLSQARTQSVVDYLVQHGVDSKRLTPKSFGITHPVATNKSKEGRERNRRVEFVLQFSSK